MCPVILLEFVLLFDTDLFFCRRFFALSFLGNIAVTFDFYRNFRNCYILAASVEVEKTFSFLEATAAPSSVRDLYCIESARGFLVLRVAVITGLIGVCSLLYGPNCMGDVPSGR